MIRKVRFVLSLEQVAFYFAAPYIILLALDETRGLFDASISQTARLWSYALLVGIYPLLQSIVAPSVGRRLDKKCSKISVLRNIHLANCVCYLFLALAASIKSFPVALLGLSIPGIVGCAAPVGKTVIASLSPEGARVKEFAYIACIKGAVKLTAPLLGAFLFQTYYTSYTPLFAISASISLCCFLYSFALSQLRIEKPLEESTFHCPTFQFFGSIINNNYPMLIVFMCLLTGYLIFVKYIPYIMLAKVNEMPSLVNYFSSLVGLAYCVNQFVVMRFTRFIEQRMLFIFVALCLSCIFFSVSTVGLAWFIWTFTTLFGFSSLATCVEAKLSLQTLPGAQGRVQGVLYSIENWCYLLAPFIGSSLAMISPQAALYFVISAALIGTLFFSFFAPKSAKSTL